ncbi:MAG TPA: ABC transporter ATP-binding protein, partial [Castellaniella sp.]|nr:ABC transporter ATP-binding protein [Castellaniella sp.]
LWEFIARLNQAGHTILLTTHYLEEAEALCGRIALLKGGRVVALDTTQALMARVGGADLEDAFVRIMHDDSAMEAEL